MFKLKRNDFIPDGKRNYCGQDAAEKRLLMKKLYFNGTIVTMEKDTYAEAVLEEDGVITVVGKKEDLELLAQDAEKVDLKGKTMLPAFIDAHSHFSAYANSLLQVPLEETVCFSEIVEKIQEFIKKKCCSGRKMGHSERI